MDTCLAGLVDGTWLTFGGEEFYIDRTTPVVSLLIFLAVVVGEKTNIPGIQILVVCLNREDRNGEFSGVEDIRLGCTQR